MRSPAIPIRPFLNAPAAMPATRRRGARAPWQPPVAVVTMLLCTAAHLIS